MELCEIQDQLAQRDRLTGALIGLARATDGEPQATESTYCTLLEGLCLTGLDRPFDGPAVARMIEQAHAERTKLVPRCSTCASPCGRNADYELETLRGEEADVRTLKTLLLLALRSMAACAWPARALGRSDAEADDFLCLGLFEVGETLTAEQLLPTVLRAGELAVRCRALLEEDS